MRGERTWTHAFNTELHWQGTYQWDTQAAVLRPHRTHPLPPINDACVWYVGLWKTVLVMSVQLRNISALLGDVMIHLWVCQRRRGNQEVDKVRDEEEEWLNCTAWSVSEGSRLKEIRQHDRCCLLCRGDELVWVAGYTDISLWYASALLDPQRASCTARHLCSVRN